MQNQALAVIWSSSDPMVARRVCFMYAHNAKVKGWFDEVTLIVWGPSAEVLAHDRSLQEAIRIMTADGIKVEACKDCADAYNVSQNLEALGIEVKYMGQPLSDMLKNGWKVLTF